MHIITYYRFEEEKNGGRDPEKPSAKAKLIVMLSMLFQA
jgi:hypothetical protein